MLKTIRPDLSIIVPCCFSLVVLSVFQSLLSLLLQEIRFKRRDSSLCSAFVNSILGDSSLTSTGAIASVPNAKANKVSRVVDLHVVLYTHSTSGRYSTHFPFRFSSLVFNGALRVLIVTSTSLLDCG